MRSTHVRHALSVCGAPYVQTTSSPPARVKKEVVPHVQDNPRLPQRPCTDYRPDPHGASERIRSSDLAEISKRSDRRCPGDQRERRKPHKPRLRCRGVGIRHQRPDLRITGTDGDHGVLVRRDQHRRRRRGQWRVRRPLPHVSKPGSHGHERDRHNHRDLEWAIRAQSRPMRGRESIALRVGYVELIASRFDLAQRDALRDAIGVTVSEHIAFR